MALESFCGYDQFKNSVKLTFGEEEEKKFDVLTKIHAWHNNELPAFHVAPNSVPRNYLKTQFQGPDAPQSMRFYKGTTTLAFVYEGLTPQDKGGIIVAVDSRATGGNYIASSTVMKCIQVTDEIFGTMAGGAADCQFWIRNLSRQCRLWELQNKEKMSVAAASKMLTNMLYNYKNMGLSVYTMVGGFDKTGANLYSLTSEGSRTKGKIFSLGSGSLNAISVVDTNYKPKMTDADAIALGKKAIMFATFRDIGSGGSVNCFHYTKEGCVDRSRTDVNEMIYKHLEDTNQELYTPE